MNFIYYFIHIYRTYKFDPLSKEFVHRPPLRYRNGVQAIFALICMCYYFMLFFASYECIKTFFNEEILLTLIFVGALVLYFGLEFYYTKNYSSIVDFYSVNR